MATTHTRIDNDKALICLLLTLNKLGVPTPGFSVVTRSNMPYSGTVSSHFFFNGTMLRFK